MLILIFLAFLVVFGAIGIIAVRVTTGNQSSDEARVALDAALKLPDFFRKDESIDIRKDVSYSSVPWLNRLLGLIRPVTNLQLLLSQADVKWTTGRFILSSLAVWVAATYAINLRTDLGWPSMFLGLLAAATPLLFVLWKKHKRFFRFQQALPDALDLMVSALRGGHSTISALGIVANEAPEPIGRELRLCFEEQNFGLDLRTAMNNLVTRIPLQDLRLVATAMVIQKESGGNLAEVLEKTAIVIRERFRLYQQIRIHTAQGRMTGWILSTLPLALGIIIYFVNPDHIRLLLTRQMGHKMIWTGLGMNAFGILIIRKIVRIRV